MSNMKKAKLMFTVGEDERRNNLIESAENARAPLPSLIPERV